MLYTDDESRDAYHKAPLLLQVVCQILESHMARFGHQVELIDTEDHEGTHSAFVGCYDAHSDELYEAALQINKNFQRKDGKVTCIVEAEEVKLLRIMVTKAEDFSQAN